MGESVTYLGEGNANLVVAIRDKDLVIRSYQLFTYLFILSFGIFYDGKFFCI